MVVESEGSTLLITKHAIVHNPKPVSAISEAYTIFYPFDFIFSSSSFRWTLSNTIFHIEILYSFFFSVQT